MRAAIAAAVVGDDCHGEDPTVTELEATVARLLGKEAALFTLTGTLANELAIGTQTRPGDEVLCEASAHPIRFEVAGPSALWGVQMVGLPTERGLLDPDEVARHVRSGLLVSETSLVWVENTHNQGGGTVVPLDLLKALGDVAHSRGLRAHLDGARLWNATAATGIPERELAAPFDTVSVCFSKGLGAPMGSALCGPADTIRRARKLRRRLGGAWRQAGILGAGALHALTHHRARLGDDHRRAARLAQRLRELPGVRPHTPETNILMVDVERDARAWVRSLAERGVLAGEVSPTRMRLVTHLDVDDEGIERAAEAFADAG